MEHIQKPNGLIIRIVKEDGGSYVLLFDMIGERVIGNGIAINHEIYGTMPLDNIIFVHYIEDDHGLIVKDLQPITIDSKVQDIIDDNEFVPLVEEIYVDVFEDMSIAKEINKSE